MTYENEELGLVVAENDTEKMWLEVKTKCEAAIKNIPELRKQLEQEEIINKAFLELAESKLIKS